jgi:hypothetical protein
MSETIDERLARWADRDAVVGLDAQLMQVRQVLADRDGEVAELRVASTARQPGHQLQLERTLQHRVIALQRMPLTQRVYRKARSVAGALRHR